MTLADIRREYSGAALTEGDVPRDPIEFFRRWFGEAERAEVQDVNAMTLATATRDGAPSARIVLLKGVDPLGFVFYTNYQSRKAAELEANPNAALVFYWPELERQVRVTGLVTRVSREVSEAYFATRPRGSQLGAWSSPQSTVLPNRAALERRLAEVEARFRDGEVPVPPDWGGFRLAPETVEFWQGRENRLHDRLRYMKEGENWRVERLAP